MRTVFWLGVAVIAAVGLTFGESHPLEARLVAANLSRDQIRSMPIVERPSRPGHFYGNAVRRRHHRQPVPVRPAQTR